MPPSLAQSTPVAVEPPDKLRVLVFNRSYYPDVEATGQLLTELCTDLSASRCVHVISGQPNFVAVKGSGVLQEDSHQGVAITRVRNLRFSKKSLLGRAAGLFTYLLLAFWVGLRARRPNVIMVETDPPLLGLLGVVLSRWHRCPLIFYLQDLYPEVGLALGRLRPGIITKFLHWATQIGLRGADRIIVLGEDMRAKVMNRGIPSQKITLVPNWADTELIYPRSRTNPWQELGTQDESLVVMYSGNLGLSQNLEQLLEAARELRDLPIRFLVIGEGAAKSQLENIANSWKLTKVHFLSYQPKEKLGDSLAAADVHFIPLRRGLAGAIVPSKLYGILAAGVPFIAAVDGDSEVARVAAFTGAGVVIPPDSAVDLAASLRWCLENRTSLPAMGRRGRQAAVAQFSRPVCVRLIDQVIAAVVGQTGETTLPENLREIERPAVFAV
jgi:colanic acid biosynthesis glycosyl transferase WcaI